MRTYLIQRGVPAGRIDTISFGKERPIAEGSSSSPGPRTATPTPPSCRAPRANTARSRLNEGRRRLRSAPLFFEVLSSASCGYQLKQLAAAAGTEWNLANHQCRRTFAYNVANSRLGRMGLVFLKWQLKHASMSWTQLYAASPHQDHALYREFEEEMADGWGCWKSWAHSDALLGVPARRSCRRARVPHATSSNS